MSHTVQASGRLFQFTRTTTSAMMRLVLPGPVKKASMAPAAFPLYAPYAIAGRSTGPAIRVNRRIEPADDAISIYVSGCNYKVRLCVFTPLCLSESWWRAGLPVEERWRARQFGARWLAVQESTARSPTAGWLGGDRGLSWCTWRGGRCLALEAYGMNNEWRCIANGKPPSVNYRPISISRMNKERETGRKEGEKKIYKKKKSMQSLEDYYYEVALPLGSGTDYPALVRGRAEAARR